MSLSAEQSRDGAGHQDRGFTLVEVIVALGLALVVMAALLPQLVAGLRGTALANDVTSSKGVLQGQLERMGNMPYFVAASATTGVDVLDTYFPNLAPPTTPTFSCSSAGRAVQPLSAWSGYVSASTATRCSYEPASGSFYRKVETTPGYVVVTDSQFLSSAVAATPPYKPVVVDAPATYDTAVVGKDTPVTSQIGVTVTAFYLNRNVAHPVTAYTQIADVPRVPTRLLGVANVRALEVGGISPAAEQLAFTAGQLNISGSLARSSSASVSSAAASARLGSAEPVGPRLSTRVAPPTATTSTTTAGAATLGGGDCSTSYACWGPSSLDALTVGADTGLPTVSGVPGAAEARLTDASAVSFRNTAGADVSLLRPALGLSTTRPTVSTSAVGTALTASTCGTSRGGWVTGRGYLQTTSTKVSVCAEAGAATVSLFPTTFAPDGVLRLTLAQATATCTVNRSPSTRAARTTYQLKVEYADPTAAGGYTTVNVTGDSNAAAPADPLQALKTKPVGGGHTVGDYIDSWSLSTPTIATSATASTASASLPGVIRLISQPLRTSGAGTDPTSAISLVLGAVSCDAEDIR